ncbi:MAG: protoporphyrinogen oxidase [Verrucomicrobiaceae bacterium]|nr:protoporphyrinogen oxidase [Verrucomicrobiaceae bacterium]
MENKKAVVIGAGISGLCAAVELKRKGFDVTLLERENHVGGVIDTFEKNGFRAESGSNSVMIQTQKTLDFLESIGLKDKIDTATPVSKKRFFVRYGKARAVPMNPINLLFTRLFTLCGKIRLFFEPFIKKFSPDSEPSVAEFITKRMGKDVLDYAINPFMAGVYGGNPEKLSVKHAFPPFWNLEQKYGSIIKGAIKSMKEKKATGNFFKPVMISFENGMKTLINALSDELKGCVKKNVKVISVDFTADGWEVSWGNNIEDVCEHYEVVVVAIPAPDVVKLALPGSISTRLSVLSEIQYAPVTTYTLGFKRNTIAHKLDGFGVLTPEKENLSILGSLFVSSVFKNRAPEGFTTLTNYIGGMRHPDYASKTQEEIENLVMLDIKKLLGVNSDPVFKKMYYWKNAIPQYNLGYQKYLDTLDEIEKDFPNISFIGSYRGGVGVSACIENALKTAEKIAKNSKGE